MLRKNKINEYLFYLAYMPWLIAWLLTYTWLKDYFHPYGFLRIWNYIGFFILLFRTLFINRFNKRYIIVTIGIVIAGFEVIQGNGNASFVFFLILILMSSQDLDSKQIIKYTFYLQSLILFVTVSSAIFGITENVSSVQYIHGNERIRYNLGFTYCTHSINFFLSIVLEYIYLKGEKLINKFNILVIILIDFYLYKMTDTNEAFILVILSLFLNWFFNKLSLYKILIFKIWMKVQYLFGAIISFILCYAYSKGNSFAIFLNRASNQRIRLACEGLSNWGVTLFGTSVIWLTDSSEYNYIDNSFINIIICYGIIIFIFILVILFVIGKKAVLNQDMGLGVALVIWMIHSIMNPQLFHVWFNPFIFLFKFNLIKDKD